MVQERGKFVNHRLNSLEYSHTKIYRSYFGYQYLIPAEYDILLNFKPIAYWAGSKIKNQSPTGQVKLRTWYQKEIKSQQQENVWIVKTPRPTRNMTEAEKEAEGLLEEKVVAPEPAKDPCSDFSSAQVCWNFGNYTQNLLSTDLFPPGV